MRSPCLKLFFLKEAPERFKLDLRKMFDPLVFDRNDLFRPKKSVAPLTPLAEKTKLSAWLLSASFFGRLIPLIPLLDLLWNPLLRLLRAKKSVAPLAPLAEKARLSAWLLYPSLLLNALKPIPLPFFEATLLEALLMALDVKTRLLSILLFSIRLLSGFETPTALMERARDDSTPLRLIGSFQVVFVS